MKTLAGDWHADVAHQGSGHAAPGPAPAVNGIQPPTPAGPFTPAPFLYIAETKMMHKASASRQTKIDGYPIVLDGTVMDVDQPGNYPAKPCENAPPNGADLVSKVVVGLAKMIKVTGKTIVQNKEVAITGDDVVLNIPTDMNTIHQSQSKLLNAAGFSALHVGWIDNPCVVKATGDPVAVASGDVIDEVADLVLFGRFDVVFKRHYASGRNREPSGPFGRGGWTHNYNQSLEIEPTRILLRNEDGRRVVFPSLEPHSETVLRGRRLRLSRTRDRYELYGFETGLTREFAPCPPGGPPRLVAVRDAWGNRVELHYEDGRLVTMVDTAKRELRFSYDREARIASIEVWAAGASWQQVAYGYTDTGELAAVTDALGRTDTYAYDGDRRLVEKKLRGGVHFRYTYDRFTAQCLRSTADGRLHNVELHYDPKARKTTVAGNPEPREYTLTEKGDVAREATFDGSAAITRTFDEDQLVLTETNAAGEVWSHEYDSHGNIVKTTSPDGQCIRCEYEHDRVVRRIDPGDRVYTCTYDEHGAPLSLASPEGRTESYSYDRFGRRTGVFGPSGAEILYTYDDQHNVVRAADGRGAVWSYEYDARGRIVAERDPVGRVTANSYDALGRLIRQRLPDGTDLAFTYDANDNLLRSTDETSSITFERFGTGSVARKTMNDGQVWEFSYDLLERLREIKNPKGELWEFRYDRAGRIVEEMAFDGQATRYRYSRAGLLNRIEYSDDTWIAYQYDEGRRLVKRESPHGSCTYERDDVGRMAVATVEDHWGNTTVEMEYGPDGLLLSQTSNGQTIRYEYDPRGQRSARTLPNGETTRYYRDGGGLIIGIDHAGEKLFFQRDAVGREVRRYAYANGLEIVTGYGVLDLPIGQYAASPGAGGARPTVIAERRWEYGPHGRLRLEHDTRWGKTAFMHDAMGRLLGARTASSGEAFAYDPAGSLVFAGPSDVEPAKRFGARMGDVLTRAGDVRFEYDERNRRRRQIHEQSGEETEYLWDCLNQLREIRLPSGQTIRFSYDAFRRRVRKTVITPAGRDEAPYAPPHVRTVDYLWDGHELAMEVDSEKGERVFVHEPETFVPVLHREQGETFTCINSRLGQPRELVDNRGRVAWAARCSAWGEVVERAQDPSATRGRPVSSPFRLLGHYHDDETGLSYARHRYFDGATAHWLSADPMGIDGGTIFGFDGSPTEHVDPLGLMTRTQFEQFLNKYYDARKQAQAAAEAHQSAITAGMGPRQKAMTTSAANSGGDVAKNEGGKHAEPNLPDVQGQAVGAGRPHCGNCTNYILQNGGVPATRIRGTGKNAWNPGDQPNNPNVPWDPAQ